MEGIKFFGVAVLVVLAFSVFFINKITDEHGVSKEVSYPLLLPALPIQTDKGELKKCHEASVLYKGVERPDFADSGEFFTHAG